MLKFFNQQNIEAALTRTAPRGFRYGYIEGLFREDIYQELINSFPDVREFQLVDKSDSGGGRKRFYVGTNYYSGRHYGCICHFKAVPPIWREVLLESISEEFLQLLKKVTQVQFNSLCAFGFTYGKEGCVQGTHIDGAARPDDPSSIHSTIACLLYFNRHAGGSTGTYICDADRTTKLFQVPNLKNSMAFFQQHPDAWHGFPVVPAGEDRRLISLSYSLENSPIIIKTSQVHKLLCPLERFQRRARQALINKLK